MSTSRRSRMTRSGIVVREDRGLGGLLCFSRHTGLVYAVAAPYSAAVTKWLDLKQATSPHEVYSRTLGAGWHLRLADAIYPIPQLLPSSTSWSMVPSPDRPILINWFITGRCPLACKYCYAEDLMRNDALEPDAGRIVDIAQSILALDPVVVVLTGGDPLFTPNLATAISALSGKVGIVVDTSGYTLRKDHLQLFSDHKVSVRVSVDSQVPRIHQSQRPVSSRYPKLVAQGETLAAAIRAICDCLETGLSVTVQTVATKKTANDLLALGDTLFRLGVHSWRVFKVAPSHASMAGYKQLVGTHMDDGRAYKGKRAKGPYEHAFGKLLEARTSQWKSQMAIQVTYSDSPNSVILVSPDGRFMTESNTGAGKVVLDAKSPFAPNLKVLRSVTDMAGHAARYLNLTTPHDDALSLEP